MQPLYSPRAYPAEIRKAIEAMPPLATEIVNRWMLGWPKATKALIEAGMLVEALAAQEAQEREALLRTDLNHLSSWEKAEVMGLSQSPPGIL